MKIDLYLFSGELTTVFVSSVCDVLFKQPLELIEIGRLVAGLAPLQTLSEEDSVSVVQH